MGTLRALVVGVSNYDNMEVGNLPFCVNDISAICEALVCGLNFNKSNIITCGETGIVTKVDFLRALNQFISTANMDDTMVFYFSGHGGTLQSGHHLVLSDSCINTQDIIENLEKAHAKNKIIFIDSCMSGNFSVGQTALLNFDESIEDFLGKGYAIFASSKDSEFSYGHPEKPLSLFTSFLCDVLKDTHIIEKGKKSLNNIQKWLSFYLDNWNKLNPMKQQHPIFRANMGGTIFFDVKKYHPYSVNQIYEETNDYIIHSVKPLHCGITKRYTVRVILKRPFSFEEISNINHEIVQKAKKFEVFQNEMSEIFLKGEDANLVFCYYGLDESDIVNGNYFCDTTWVDDEQDKTNWYRLDSNSEIINDVHFHFHPYYESSKTFAANNCNTMEEVVKKTKRMLSQLITLAEQVIALYNEFLNGSIDEQILVEEMDKFIQPIQTLYSETDSVIPPIELHDWSECCSCLAGTIHDFTLFYNKESLMNRTYENRIDCMNLKITTYYEDLEEFNKLEAQRIQS